jgi:hypothetical protein
MGWATFRAIFSQTHLVTLAEDEARVKSFNVHIAKFFFGTFEKLIFTLSTFESC